jgi:hypothetical protein
MNGSNQLCRAGAIKRKVMGYVDGLKKSQEIYPSWNKLHLFRMNTTGLVEGKTSIDRKWGLRPTASPIASTAAGYGIGQK